MSLQLTHGIREGMAGRHSRYPASGKASGTMPPRARDRPYTSLISESDTLAVASKTSQLRATEEEKVTTAPSKIDVAEEWGLRANPRNRTSRHADEKEKDERSHPPNVEKNRTRQDSDGRTKREGATRHDGGETGARRGVGARGGTRTSTRAHPGRPGSIFQNKKLGRNFPCMVSFVETASWGATFSPRAGRAPSGGVAFFTQILASGPLRAPFGPFPGLFRAAPGLLRPLRGRIVASSGSCPVAGSSFQ